MVAVLAWAAVVFLLDQAVKRAARTRYAGDGLRLSQMLTLRHIPTRRRHFAHTPARILLVLAWMAATASTLVLARLAYFDSALSHAAIGAAVGGAAGNLFDIIDARAVHDYIDLSWWPAFNIADVAILGGLSIAFLTR